MHLSLLSVESFEWLIESCLIENIERLVFLKTEKYESLFIEGFKSLFEPFGFVERLFKGFHFKGLVLKFYLLERFWFRKYCL